MDFIQPDWPVSSKVKVFTTTRCASHDTDSLGNFNLSLDVGDRPERVEKNRQQLGQVLDLPGPPVWLNQVHGNRVITLGKMAQTPAQSSVQTSMEKADGSYTRRAGIVCCVMTADCLPLVIASSDGKALAVLHCGWRSLQANIIAAGLSLFEQPRDTLHAWLGPAIGPDAFEVGDEVREIFLHDSQDFSVCFRPKADRWRCNIYDIARGFLRREGVSNIYGGNRCTLSEWQHFYSFRRDGKTGRMATVAWIKT